MKNRHPDLEYYFKYRYYTNLADESLQHLEHDPDFIHEIITTKFNDVEIYIFNEYLVKQRSLKSIASELNYTYSYTRQILFRAREKLNLLLDKKNIHEK